MEPSLAARNAGWMVLVLGLTGAVASVFALGIVLFQVFILHLPSRRPPPAAVQAGFEAFHSVCFVHLPIWLALGLVTALVGNGLRRGLSGAAPRALLALAAGAVEMTAYAIHSTAVIAPAWEPLFALNPLFSRGAFTAFLYGSALSGTVTTWILLGGLAWQVWRATKAQRGS